MAYLVRAQHQTLSAALEDWKGSGVSVLSNVCLTAKETFAAIANASTLKQERGSHGSCLIPDRMESLRTLIVRSLVLLLCSATTASLRGQHFQLGIGAGFFAPQGSLAEQFSGAVGPTLGIDYCFGERYTATFQISYTMLLVKGEAQDVLNAPAIVPMQLGSKFFLTEDHKGTYFHMLVGAHGLSQRLKDDPLNEASDGSFSVIRSSVGLGFGFQRCAFDLALRYVYLFTKEEERSTGSPSWSYLGLHATYRLLGK